LALRYATSSTKGSKSSEEENEGMFSSEQIFKALKKMGKLAFGVGASVGAGSIYIIGNTLITKG
jgi:hypothetical protein